MSLKKEKIISIEEIQNDGQYVYDFEVPESHVFLANDIIVHNTDSIMITAKKEIDVTQYLEEFHKWLSVQLKTQYNVDKHIIELEFDRVYKPFCLISKKAYSGRVLNQEGKKTDYIYSRGIDVVKSSACPAVIKIQTEVIDLIIMQHKDKEFFKDWLASVKKTIFDKMKLPEDLIIHQKINKELGSYKNKPLAAIIAERKLKREGKLVSTEIEYIITGRAVVETENPQTHKITRSNRLTGVEPEFFEGKYDKPHYWDNVILPCIDRFLKTAFPDTEWTKEYQFDAEKIKQLQFEKIQKDKERERLKLQKKKEREEKKKEREKLKIKREQEREQKKAAREKLKEQREKDKALKRQQKLL